MNAKKLHVSVVDTSFLTVLCHDGARLLLKRWRSRRRAGIKVGPVSGFAFLQILWQLARLRSDEDEGSAFGGSLHAVVASSRRDVAASIHQVFGFAD